MNYQLTKNNLHIDDSWKVRKKDMIPWLIDLFDADVVAHNYDLDQCSSIWQRSMYSLRAEWVCHNFLYSVGLWRSRTKDVDLDFPCDRPEWVYKVCAALVWVFVK